MASRLNDSTYYSVALLLAEIATVNSWVD